MAAYVRQFVAANIIVVRAMEGGGAETNTLRTEIADSEFMPSDVFVVMCALFLIHLFQALASICTKRKEQNTGINYA